MADQVERQNEKGGGLIGRLFPDSQAQRRRRQSPRRPAPKALASLGIPAAPGEVGGAGSTSLFDVGAPGGLQQRLG